MAKNKDHHLEKRNGAWYFVAMVNGERIRKAVSTSIAKARTIRDHYLDEIRINGSISQPEPAKASIPFGEVAQQWVSIKRKKVKASTLRDYRGAMNFYILPRFGDTPIDKITYLDIEKFISDLKCTAKRINNILVPMRSVMKFALKAGFIEKDPLSLVGNLKVDKPDIDPLSMKEVHHFIEAVIPLYKPYFIVAFFTGMRFGEMSALKWHNVDFKLGVIKVRETRVNGEEGRPKTPGSIRDIKILPPVLEALKEQAKATKGKTDYVFLNSYGRPLVPNSVNFSIWKPALKKAGLKPRSLYQTRHTFATLMLDAGELPGWVQTMMGHETLKMILERYYSYIKNYQRDDGSAFMEQVYKPSISEADSGVKETETFGDFTPNLPQGAHLDQAGNI